MPRRALLPVSLSGSSANSSALAEYTLHEAALPQGAARQDACQAAGGDLLAVSTAAEMAAVHSALVRPQRRLWLGLRQANLSAGGAGAAAASQLLQPFPAGSDAPGGPQLGALRYRWSGGAVGSFSAFAAAPAGVGANVTTATVAAGGAACTMVDSLTGEWHAAPCSGVAGFACQAREVVPEQVLWSAVVGGVRYAHVALPQWQAAAVAAGVAEAQPAAPWEVCGALGMSPARLETPEVQAALLQHVASANSYWTGYATEAMSGNPPTRWTDGTPVEYTTPVRNAGVAAAAAAQNSTTGAAYCGTLVPTALPAVSSAGVPAYVNGSWLLAPCGAAAAAPLCAGSAMSAAFPVSPPPAVVPSADVSASNQSSVPQAMYLVHTPASYTTARAGCEALGGTLAVFEGGAAGLANVSSWHAAWMGRAWMGLRWVAWEKLFT